MKRRRSDKKFARSHNNRRLPISRLITSPECDSPKPSYNHWLLYRIASAVVGLFANLFCRNPKSTSSKYVENLEKRLELLENTVAQLTKNVKRLQKRRDTNSVTSNVTTPATSATIPPPPPFNTINIPPPPVMIIPPPPPPSLSFKTASKPLQSSQVSSTSKPKPARAISIMDLKSIKLKRPSEGEDVLKQTPQRSRMQMVTLRDLQNVQLRKRTVKTDDNKVCQSPKVVGSKLKGLKKTNIIRSPGGTPMVKHNTSSGEGLTPAFTKALKKKFESVKVSPIESSPRKWRC